MTTLVLKSLEIARSVGACVLELADSDASYEYLLAMVEGALEGLEDLPAPIDCKKLALTILEEHYDT